ncbi:MAG: sulfatase-like hydrolase/transferase, partial [Alphaproteobacteria bacterium]
EVAYAARRLEQPGENLPYKRGFFGLMLSDDYHYSKIAEKVIEMEHGKKPWFTTIMTTSTHTPYNINPDYFKRYKTNHEAAFRFADDELKKFLARLDNAGILDHTLIFITGDESRLRKDKHVDPGRWSRHWSTLVVKTPNNTQYKREDYFMHADIADSVLDYLGNVSGKERFRSVFRTYETFRPVMFSGVYTKIWGAIPEPDRLLTCRSNFTECSAHYISGPLFTGRILKPAPMHDLQFFISATRHSDLLVTQPHSTNKPAAKKKVKKRKRRILRPPNMPW